MALVVFLRGVNVGGHRRLRPSALANELNEYWVVNVGAAGTFIVRNPGSRAKFHAELRRRLPFETKIVCCDGREVLRLETGNPFAAAPPHPDAVRFVSVLARACGATPSFPVTLPESGEWLVRLIGARNRFVFGLYRRHMKTIGYLSGIDKLCGAPAITRNWNTVLEVVRILKTQGAAGAPKPSRRG